jgi:HPt (histidine-containing phosphotransfer) domain-containing protein
MLRWLPGLDSLRRPADAQVQSGKATSIPGAAPGAIDLAGLATLVGNDEPEYLREILAMFWDDVQTTPMELQRLYQSRDADALARAAHAAKGAAASACARTLSSLLLDLETNAKRSSWQTIEILMPPIVHAFEDLHTFIVKNANGSPPAKG